MEKGKSKQKESKNKPAVNETVKNMNAILEKIKGSAEHKEDFQDLVIENASEVPIEENKRCYLVQIATPSDKILKKVHNILVKQFEENFSMPVEIIPSKKRINGNLYRRYRGTKVPRERTLTNVFDGYLEDLLYPATMVGKRIRYPKGKVRCYKVFVDPLDKKTIEYKVPSITACYKALTNRALHIEFPEH